MIRPKRKVDPMMRVEQDILKSRCFSKIVDKITQNRNLKDIKTS